MVRLPTGLIPGPAGGVTDGEMATSPVMDKLSMQVQCVEIQHCV